VFAKQVWGEGKREKVGGSGTEEKRPKKNAIGNGKEGSCRGEGRRSTRRVRSRRGNRKSLILGRQKKDNFHEDGQDT